MSARTKAQTDDRENALRYLRERFAPGSVATTLVRHVSRSGMSRTISLLAAAPDGAIEDASWAVAKALGWRFDRERGGVKVDGCGMDMGFHLVYSLSHVLFPAGFGCIGEHEGAGEGGRRLYCPSSEHSNGDRDYTRHIIGCERREDERLHWHRDGGYALRHRWL